MTNSTQKAAQPQTTKHGHKWCEHCQKTDHNDEECWSTLIVSTAETMARRLPQRKPGIRIFYRTSYVIVVLQESPIMTKFLLAALLSISTLASAQEAQEGVKLTLTPQLSTLGAGVSIGSYSLGNNFKLRGNINGLTVDKDFRNNSVLYSGKLNLQSAGLIGDYYFSETSGFHASAGLYYNNNSVKGTGTYNGNVAVNTGMGVININPSTYGNVGFEATFPKVAPYFGLGYHTQAKEGLSFALDLGLLYQGNAKMTYDMPGAYQSLANVNPAFNTLVQNNKQYLQDQANKFKIYPVISIGVGYTF